MPPTTRGTKRLALPGQATAAAALRLSPAVQEALASFQACEPTAASRRFTEAFARLFELFFKKSLLLVLVLDLPLLPRQYQQRNQTVLRPARKSTIVRLHLSRSFYGLRHCGKIVVVFSL